MIVLASSSPRRRELLEEAGIVFTVDPAGVDETLDASVSVDEAAECLARRKALAVAARHGADDFVIGADTIVVVPRPDQVASTARSGGKGSGAAWELLGKPVSPSAAAAMLRRLSATRHRVMTGVYVARGAARAPGKPDAEGDGLAQGVSGLETTWVTMREITAAEIDAYVASGEWRGKAGGYAIQETADAFVTSLEEGGFDNVVGLPVALTLDLLARAGGRAPGRGSS